MCFVFDTGRVSYQTCCTLHMSADPIAFSSFLLYLMHNRNCEYPRRYWVVSALAFWLLDSHLQHLHASAAAAGPLVPSISLFPAFSLALSAS
jgi:hypothetical protein